VVAVSRVHGKDPVPETRVQKQVDDLAMQADDEAMRLRVTGQGVEEVDSKALMLKFPITKGSGWVMTLPGEAERRSFRVLSAGEPCRSGGVEFESCAVVEESDGSGLRTIVTYAQQVGPVQFEYFQRSRGRETRVQTLEWNAERLH
jgi:hypothetical protein